MELEEIEVTENTVELNLSKIIEAEDKTKLKQASKAINVWLPNNYDNLVNKAFGKVNINVPGELVFNFEQQKIISLPFQSKTFVVDLVIQSKNLLNYDLQTKGTYTNEKTNLNETIYHVTLQNTDNITLAIPCSDIISWSLQINNDEKRNFTLTFIPNYIDIIQNIENENKKLKKKQKHSKKQILNLQVELTKQKSSQSDLKEKMKQFTKVNNELTKCKSKVKQISLELSDLKIEDCYKRIQLTKNEKKIKNIQDENLLLKTNLDKFREENKELAMTLKQQNDSHKMKLTEQNAEFKNLEKINTENVNQLFVKDFENQELEYEIEVLKNDIAELTKTNKTIVEENKTITEEHKRIVKLNTEQSIELTNIKKELEAQLKTNNYLHNDYKQFYLQKNKKLTEEVKELTKENEKLIRENEDIDQLLEEKDYNLTMKENLELEVIDFKLKNTELELKIENLNKKIKRLEKNNNKKNKTQHKQKLQEIFDWYKNAMPNTKNIKLKNNEFMEFIRNLESEITMVFKEFIF